MSGYSQISEMDRREAGTSTSAPLFKSKRYHPYFTPREIAFLSDKQRGKLSYNLEEKTRREACNLIEVIGSRLGFPHRTIGTAQSLFHRFHLFFPMKDFAYWDVAHACLYVSTKVHDTLKKPRDIIVASYHVRFPEEAEKARAKGGEMEINPKNLDIDKLRLVAVERLVLETICFNFKVHTPHSYVIKAGRALGASKELTKLAYKLAIDSHRTVSPLEHPPHIIALASLYLAALLTAFPEHGGVSVIQETEWSKPASTSNGYENRNGRQAPAEPPRRTARDIGEELGQEGRWCRQFGARVFDLQEVAHRLLDLLSSQPAQAIHSLSTSPQTPLTPTSPSPNQPSPIPHGPAPSTTAFTPAHLTRLKIFLREREAAMGPPPIRPQISQEDPSTDYTVGPGAVNILSGNADRNAATEVWNHGREAPSVRFFFD
ncbi:cyclin-like protein [Dacryopinax primogenitus]|uniref:Cyclin-like protein n=1 Tax=Dacryopinax primogenitus (strain DJM 731) TaxID=1858805 RepID=M5GEB9_DACPD|nr:cyclin-like protein [Dacryopinax primogenitus]EJU03138.1 cyclin-like protein [Dacryopinax primogenitus]